MAVSIRRRSLCPGQEQLRWVQVWSLYPFGKQLHLRLKAQGLKDFLGLWRGGMGRKTGSMASARLATETTPALHGCRMLMGSRELQFCSAYRVETVCGASCGIGFGLWTVLQEAAR